MSRRIPPVQALNCFEAAARLQSFTRAAEALHLTQGAVSRQIAGLEAFLGVPLFRRTRHGMVLTDAGESYARQVARHLDDLERDTLEAMTDRLGAGVVNLATVPTFAARWLIPRLPDFARAHPRVTVNLESEARPFLFAQTRHDAAIHAGAAAQVAAWTGTTATFLMSETVTPVASPALLGAGRRWRPADLLSLPLLQQSTRPDAWAGWFANAGVAGTDSMMRGARYDLFSMLAAAASAGLGVALIPPFLIERELAAGQLVTVVDRPMPGLRDYYLVKPTGRRQAPGLAAFESWLLSQVAAGREPMDGVAPRA